MALTAAHRLQVQLILSFLQVLLLSPLNGYLIIHRLHLNLHLRNLHVHFTDSLSLLRQNTLIVTFFLRELDLVLLCEFVSQALHLYLLFVCELLPQDAFHLLVDVLGRLSVIYDLLLLHLDLLAPETVIKLTFFCLLDHFTLQFYLLL